MSTPCIPQTPSPSLNAELEFRFGKPPGNRLNFYVAHTVCGFFRAVVVIYNSLNKSDTKPNVVQKMWAVSCAVVGIGMVFASWVVYSVILSLSFVVHGALFYASILIAVAGIGLGVFGVAFFNRPISPNAAAAQEVKTGRSDAMLGYSDYSEAQHVTTTTTVFRTQKCRDD